MEINTKIFIGFLSIIVLILAQVTISHALQDDLFDNTLQIKEVEAPLEATTYQVFTCEALLTEHLHVALLHAIKGNYSEIQDHKREYDEIAVKLNDLVKKEARMLLWQSERPQEVKEKIEGYLKTIDDANTNILDLETRAFEAMERNDTKTAYSLIFGEEYDRYERELGQAYADWTNTEQELSLNIHNNLLRESRRLIYINLGVSIAIMVMVIITLFMIRSFVAEGYTRKVKRK